MNRRMIAVAAAVVLWWCGLAQAAEAGKVLLLVAEQNINGPQHGWWASEIDLSSVETAIAKKLIEAGYTVVDPDEVKDAVEAKPAFRLLNISSANSVKLGRSAGADYIVKGKAVASAGGTVPHSSTMRACYANVTIRIIDVKKGSVVASADATGSSVHPDVVTGGKEALAVAGEAVAKEIIAALARQQGGK